MERRCLICFVNDRECVFQDDLKKIMSDPQLNSDDKDELVVNKTETAKNFFDCPQINNYGNTKIMDFRSV